MSDALVLGLAGILASAVVGPAAAGWIARQKQKADHAHDIARERREIVDGAARSVRRAQDAEGEMVRAWRNEIFPSDPKGMTTVRDLEAAVEDVQFHHDRIIIRFGRGHPIEASFKRLSDTVRTGFKGNLVPLYINEHPRDHSVVAKITEARGTYKAQREEFLTVVKGNLSE